VNIYQFLIFLIFIQGGLAKSQSTPEELSTLAYSPYWLRLLHYQKKMFGGYESRLEGSDFFFSSQGKTNPLEELKSTVASFSKNLKVGRLQQHPQCAFPERFRFLKEKLQLKIPQVQCPKLTEYLERFNPESVTLVFSSAYPHNPGSMFGHTFLRINTKIKDAKKQDLLDWGISYAAQVAHDENGFSFVFLGLTGGYRGQFSLLPYYAKVHEYVNNESRDLWEYELDLNTEETYRLLRNIWEVETNSYFDYYFLDENCSFLLLAFLEVAKPEWSLTDFSIYVIPGETIKKVSAIPGAIRKITYRPSLQKKMMAHYGLLDSAQKEAFQDLISYRLTPSEVKEPKVLDQLSEYLLYLKKNKSQLSQEENRLFRLALVQRSQLGEGSQTEDVGATWAETSRPDLAHDTYRLGVSSGYEQRGQLAPKSQLFYDIQFKFAFHDLLNSDLGYTPFSQVDFPGVTLRYYQRSDQIRLENIHLLSVTSLSPLKPLEKHPSWAFHLERLSPKDLLCDHCQAFHLDLGGGGSLEIGSQRGVFYSLAFLQGEVANHFGAGWRFLPKWELGMLIQLAYRYKIQLQFDWMWDLFQKDRRNQFYQWQLNQSLSLSKSWDFRALLQSLIFYDGAPPFYEGKVSLNYYF